MAMNNALRSASRLVSSTSESLLSKSVSRSFHSTGVKRMGGHAHDEPFYMHAKHMYNLDRMRYQKLTMSLAVLTAFSIGVGVPIYAVVFQQKKASSAQKFKRDIGRMKNKKIAMMLAASCVFGIGAGVPYLAAVFQQKITSSS
ncbi:hypothetical protein ACFE04_007848 [Oxalis oulophora]